MKTVNVELTHEEAKTIMTILGQHCWQEGFEDNKANSVSRKFDDLCVEHGIVNVEEDDSFACQKKFQARCNDGSGKTKHLGYFDTELEAHQAWLKCKQEVALELAAEQTDPRVAKALIERYENYVAQEKELDKS
jgi:hypothetical protein